MRPLIGRHALLYPPFAVTQGKTFHSLANRPARPVLVKSVADPGNIPGAPGDALRNGSALSKLRSFQRDVLLRRRNAGHATSPSAKPYFVDDSARKGEDNAEPKRTENEDASTDGIVGSMNTDTTDRKRGNSVAFESGASAAAGLLPNSPLSASEVASVASMREIATTYTNSPVLEQVPAVSATGLVTPDVPAEPATTLSHGTASAMTRQNVNSVFEGTESASTGVWSSRSSGALPRRKARESRQDTVNETRNVEQDKVFFPTCAQLIGRANAEIYRDVLLDVERRDGRLPRLTLAIGARASRACHDAYERASDSRTLLSEVRNSSWAVPEEQTERLVEGLNPAQREAVLTEPGRPCLVLAGPGSGKTRVLTHRVAYLIDALGVNPNSIMAVTFTNKAANEMKERIENLLAGSKLAPSQTIVVGTFHSICAQLLRKYGHLLGISSNFVILDVADARAVVGEVVKANLPAEYSAETVKRYASQISMLKNDMLDKASSPNERAFAKIDELRRMYDERLRSMNMVDFDDLLWETRRLLVESTQVRESLQARYRHILVDEWQDSNSVQYDIALALAREHRNLFVVGDADQSIYGFRGAKSENISNFCSDLADTSTIALLDNYRSTGRIVQAAQGVIQKNRNRPEKGMRTKNAAGAQIIQLVSTTPKDESWEIAKRVKNLVSTAGASSYSDFAILYRMHSQSRHFEEAFIAMGIPYRLYGGLRFYERKEVKDVLGYLRLAANQRDDVSFKRVVNVPTRGIGPRTVEKLEATARLFGLSVFEVVELLADEDKEDVSLAGAEENAAGDVPYGEKVGSPKEDAVSQKLASLAIRGNTKQQLLDFVTLIHQLREFAEDPAVPAADVVSRVLQMTKYADHVQSKTDDSETSEKKSERLKNIAELSSAAEAHENLESFLAAVSLVSDASDADEKNENISSRLAMMSLHGGKGMEFPQVFITGVEEKSIPMRVIDEGKSDEDHIEEERRLFYVGMTRAKQVLTLSRTLRRDPPWAKGKKSFVVPVKPSRFLENIDSALIRTEWSKKASEQALSDNADRPAMYPVNSKSGRRGRGKTHSESSIGYEADDFLVSNRKTVTYGSSRRKVAEEYVLGKEPNGKLYNVGDNVRDENFGFGTVVTTGPEGLTQRTDNELLEVRFSDGATKWVQASGLRAWPADQK